jgi:hypothetical protein
MLWLIVLLFDCASCAQRAICPPTSDGRASKIVVDCGVVRARGHCDALGQCQPSGTNDTCVSRTPCAAHAGACVCASEFTCKRRLECGEIALLLCQRNNHEKRQEALAADDDDNDDDGADQGPSDDTAAFLGILAAVYLVLLCIALIYI